MENGIIFFVLNVANEFTFYTFCDYHSSHSVSSSFFITPVAVYCSEYASGSAFYNSFIHLPVLFRAYVHGY